MFNKKKETTVIYDNSAIKELQFEISELKHNHRLEIEKLQHKHEMELEDIKFEMKNFKDSEILEKNNEIVSLTNKNDVLTKENEMMKEMVDINADIVDVKDVINKLIDKLPTINLENINVNSK